MRKFSQLTLDEDAPLLLSWYRGDLTAFETLIWKYQKRIFNLALLLTGGHKTACEVAENTFITAYQNIRVLKSTGRFSSWLVTLALKECRALNDFRADAAEPPPEAAVDPADTGSYSAALHRKLVLCIKELPFELSEVILLRYVRGYSLDRIEEILQINGEHLLSRLFEAQETLACWLKSGTENPAELLALKAAHSSIHPEIRRNFSAYLDNSTEGDEKERTKAHLTSCGSCREALAELEWMVEDIKSIPDLEPPHWLASAIIQKVKILPELPTAASPPARFTARAAVAAGVIVIIGGFSYLLQQKAGPEPNLAPNTPRSPAEPPVQQKGGTAGSDFGAILKGAFKGAVTTTGSSLRGERTSPPVPLPPLPPAEAAPAVTPAVKPLQPAGEGKNDPLPRRDRPETAPTLLQEWGDSSLPGRAPQKKSPPGTARSGEVAVVLASSDPAAAVHDIERAVISSGGRITGRAYSSGSDILYTRVDAERFFDLMERLGKIARIQELPQLPEGAEGSLDLTIRW